MCKKNPVTTDRKRNRQISSYSISYHWLTTWQRYAACSWTNFIIIHTNFFCVAFHVIFFWILERIHTHTHHLSLNLIIRGHTGVYIQRWSSNVPTQPSVSSNSMNLSFVHRQQVNWDKHTPKKKKRVHALAQNTIEKTSNSAYKKKCRISIRFQALDINFESCSLTTIFFLVLIQLSFFAVRFGWADYFHITVKNANGLLFFRYWFVVVVVVVWL